MQYLGANGWPFGWSQEFQERWIRIKNDPAKASHWTRLDSHWKYALTQDPQYLPGGVAFSQTILDNLTYETDYETGIWCGTQASTARSVSSSATLNVNMYSEDTPISTNISTIALGNKIKITGLSLPTEYTNGNDYYVVQRNNTLIGQGVTNGYAIEGVYDSHVNFVTMGVLTTDLVEHVSSGILYPIVNVSTNLLSTTGGADRNFFNGAQYKIWRYTMELSEFVNGPSIVASSTSTMNYQPFDRLYYYTPGCLSTYSRDALKDDLLFALVRYMIFRNALTPIQREKALDVYYKWSLKFINDDYTSGGATDYFHDGFTIILLASLALKDEDKTIFNTTLYNSLVNYPKFQARTIAVRNYIGTILGGPFPDTICVPGLGTNYDPGTVIAFVRWMKLIDNYTGNTTLLEANIRTSKLGEYLKAHFQTHNFTQRFEWSDNGSDKVYSNLDYGLYDMCAIIGDITKDPELWYIWDQVGAIGGRQFYSIYAGHSPFDDPYATRATQAAYNAKMTNAVFNDSRRNVCYFHTGNTASDSKFYSNDFTDAGSPGHFMYQDIGLTRKNECMIDWSRGYASGDFHKVVNMFWPFSSTILAYSSVPTQQDFQHGTKWLYTKGTRRNANNSYPTRYTEFTGAGNLIEQSRETLYYRCANGADLVVVHDTLETFTGNNGTSTRTDSNGTTWNNVPNNLKGVENCQDNFMTLAAAAGYKHTWRWHLPTATPTYSSSANSWSWNGMIGQAGSPGRIGTQLMTLNTFVPSYSYTIEARDDGQASYQCTYDGTSATHFLKVKAEADQFGRFQWVHAFYARSASDATPTYTRTSTGLNIVVAGETIVADFSPTFALTVNGSVQQDSSASSCSSSSSRSSSSSCRSSSSSSRSSSSSSKSSSSSSCRSSSSSKSSSSSSCRSSSSSSRSSSSSSRSSSCSSSSSRSSSSSCRSSSSSCRSSSSSSAAPFGIFLDAVSTGTGAGSGSVNVAHTITLAGTGHYLVVALGWKNPGTVSDVSWAGTSMTLAISKTVNVFSTQKVDLYYLVSPTRGSSSVIVNVTGNYNGLSVGVLSFIGSSGAVPEITGGSTGSGGSISTNVTTTSNNCVLVDVATTNYSNQDWSVGSNQVKVLDRNISDGGGHGVSYKQAGSSGSQTMSWTYNSGGQGIAHAVLAIPSETAVASSSSCSSCSSSSCRSSSSSSRSSSSSSKSSSSSCCSSSSSSYSFAGGLEDIVLDWVVGSSSSCSSSSSCKSSSSSSSRSLSSSSSSSSSSKKNSSSSSQSSSSFSFGWRDVSENTIVEET